MPAKKAPGRNTGARSGGSPSQLGPEVLQAATLSRVRRRVAAKGTVVLPALPSLLDHHVEFLATVFSALQRPSSAADRAGMRSILGQQMEEVYRFSSHGSIRVDYETSLTSEGAVSFMAYPQPETLASKYQNWVDRRGGPLFGLHPDARLMDLVAELGEPARCRVLDVGAGNGRNALPLARRGFSVDAFEPVQRLAGMLRADAEHERLPVVVVEQNFLRAENLPEQRYGLVLLSEVLSELRSVEELRATFERAARVLLPGGLLLFNIFLCRDGYTPTQIARELSQSFWCSIFTRPELRQATEGLPFELVSDEVAFTYERDHAPEGAFPPTTWFPQWSAGMDVYDVPPGQAPMHLRWLLYRRALQ